MGIFDPVTGFFNVTFWLAGIATNMIGFGLCVVCHATERKVLGKSYFWVGTIGLVVGMAGLSLFITLG